MSEKLVELIETETLRGTGKDGDAVRTVTQWWTKAGVLVVERDEWLAELVIEKLEEQRVAAHKAVLTTCSTPGCPNKVVTLKGVFSKFCLPCLEVRAEARARNLK